MTNAGNPLRIRHALGRLDWDPPEIPAWLPQESIGSHMWYFRSKYNRRTVIIVSCAEFDGVEWVHASISHPDKLPSYDELALMHRAVFADGFAYQVFAPSSEHVNIHEYALHLWGREDGAAITPRAFEYAPERYTV